MSPQPFFNRIELRLKEGKHGHGPEVGLFVDGRDLVDLLREYEVLFAWREGDLNRAGAYAGIPASRGLRLAEALLGRGDREDLGGLLGAPGKIMLLSCECGEAPCWPMFARVQFGSGVVSWSEFEQVYRPGWDYGRFGPFVFELGQYRAAVRDFVESLVPTARKSA